MEIKDYIQLRVTQHRALAEKLYNETRDMVEQPRWGMELLKQYQASEAARLMQENINAHTARQIAVDMTYNAEVKSIIKTARRASLPDAVRNFTPAADYQMQIGNALTFLNAAGDKLTDAEAFEILKPFFNDWGKMRMFEGIVAHNSDPMQADVYSVRKRFPNTFGGIMGIADMHTALFNAAERTAEGLFLSNKNATMTAYIDGFAYEGAVVCDSYEDRAAQDRIIELADKIDHFSVDGALVLNSLTAPDNILAPDMGSRFKDDNGAFVWDN